MGYGCCFRETGRRRRRPLPVCAIFFILIVGRWLAAAVCKNIIVFCAGSRGRLPLRVWWFLNIIPVGEDTILPSFSPKYYRVSTKKPRTATSRPRRISAVPLGFITLLYAILQRKVVPDGACRGSVSADSRLAPSL